VLLFGCDRWNSGVCVGTAVWGQNSGVCVGTAAWGQNSGVCVGTAAWGQNSGVCVGTEAWGQNGPRLSHLPATSRKYLNITFLILGRFFTSIPVVHGVKCSWVKCSEVE
jgi:hypothetical protein